jgi:uncharacterized protein YcbK (DUF882 family)
MTRDRDFDEPGLTAMRWTRLLAAFAMAVFMLVGAAAGAAAETRSLKLYFVHTGEKAEIVFKRNGRYDQAGLKKLNQFLRDWRRNEPTRMDPRLFDLIYSVYKSVGARDYINVVGGYRSPSTNSMLRSRSKGVAEKSQHILGKAMDFYIPGVSLKKLRETGMKMQVGGVGYYPRSGSPFVHMDVGNVRHWPKMSRKELLALFPSGKTLHVPSDGKPLPGFQEALASYQARKKSGDSAIAMVSGGNSGKKPATNLLAAFFGGGADDEEDTNDAEAAPPVVKPVKAAPPKAAQPEEEPVVAATKPLIDTNAPAKPIIEIVPPAQANRVELPAPVEAEEEPTPEAIIAALPARAIPLPQMAPRPSADVGPTVTATASIPAAPEPEQIPFGMAQAAPEELRPAADAAPEEVPFQTAAATPADLAAGQVAVEPEPAKVEVAANVPIPSWRPDEPAPAQAAPVAQTASIAPAASMPLTEEDQSLLMAMASPDPPPSANAVAVPTADDEAFPVSALPETAPAPSMPPPEMGAEQKAAVEAEIKANGKRVVALASAEAASPKLALASSAPGADPATVISGGVKTTSKSGRAKAVAGKRIPRSVVLAPAPEAARWVLTKDYVTKVTQATKAPSFAYNTVVSAPREVYTAGFQKGKIGDANRFTGNAVKFLSVARFQ